MKVLAVLVLCAFVTVQGRSAGGKRQLNTAALGDAPYVVHLRVARSTSGYLDTAVGSLLADRWVLTSNAAVQDARFIWIRYAAVNVINPTLVTETGAAVPSPDGILAIISINRIVQASDYIAPVALTGGSVPESTTIYLYGENEEGGPGEVLRYFTIDLKQEEDSIIGSSDEGAASKFDLGAPLVSEGVQIGVLVKPGGDDNAGEFVPTAGYLDWIQAETGVSVL